ncbi:MAG: FtsX-like permease family protein, partial [Opitutales bacterium]|nr:FtsX-like permease family protein [Opitutales bacterium]
MQQVNRENALLVSLGIGPKRIGRWRLLSSFMIVLIGTLLALPLAAGYTWGILRFLETIWSPDSTGSLFAFRASPQTIAIGVLSNILLALSTIWYTLRRQSKIQVSFRLQQGSEETVMGREWKRGLSLTVGICGIVFGGVTLILSLFQMLPIQVGYFLAGFFWLVGGIGFCASRIGLDRDTNGSSID